MQLDFSNKEFKMAWSFVNYTDQNLFLTGNAGTGKTTFLHQIKNLCPKKMAVVAPTGVAAINAGGVTIHSFFQLPFGTFIPDDHPQWNDPNQRTFNKQSLFRNLRLRRKQRDIIRNLELLIIDEVSMVRADMLDAIDITLKGVRRNHDKPFGGVQVLFIGDLFQLPPVVKEEDWHFLGKYYESPFFFDAQVLKNNPPIAIELQKIYRQKNDHQFIEILNKIRFNKAEQHDLDILNQNIFQGIDEQKTRPITLTTHNNKADRINQQELNKLPGKETKINAIVKKDFPEHSYPAESTLVLKEGAQVMFIKNDKGDDRKYYNGKIGFIHKLNLTDDTIEIKCEGEDEYIELSMEQWDNIRYEYDEKNDEIKENKIGSFSQYPIRLAWAVTIHKSQGLTFEEAYIDLSQAFAAGQTYVALSRLTNLNGLKLLNPIQRHHILTEPKVLQFYAYQPKAEDIENYLDLQQQYYIAEQFIDIFDLDELCEEIRAHAASYGTKIIEEKQEAFNWAQDLLPSVFSLLDASEKYITYLKAYLLQNNKKSWQAVAERNTKAIPFFNAHLHDHLKYKVINQIEKYKKLKFNAAYLKELDVLLHSIEDKITLIQHSPALINAIVNEDEIENALKNLFELKNKINRDKPIAPSSAASKKPKTKAKAERIPSDQVSLQLFQSGKSIEAIAEERSLKQDTILGHLIKSYPAYKLHIDDLVDANIRKQIVKLLHDNPEWGNKDIFDFMEGVVNYNDIRASRAYFEHIMKSEEDKGE